MLRTSDSAAMKPETCKGSCADCGSSEHCPAIIPCILFNRTTLTRINEPGCTDNYSPTSQLSHSAKCIAAASPTPAC